MDIRRDLLDADVVIVGAGPAGLACAIRLAQLIRDHNPAGRAPPLAPEGVYVLEKGAELGMHTLSGAVMDPRALLELIDRAGQQQAPMGMPVTSEHIWWLTRGQGYRLPYIPPFLRNGGNRVLSLGRLVGWLASYAERLGINVITGTAAKSLLLEENKVAGLYTDDKGIDKSGRRKTHFQPGSELRCRVVVLAEGARGSLTKQLTEHFKLNEGCNPQVYALGLKEIWEIPPGRIAAGTVIHTAGYPMSSGMYGGGWLYALDGRRVSLGLITGLHYRDPRFDPHAALQLLKLHPKIRPILEGGDLICYGAKTIPTGGYWAIPRLYTNGALIVGDSAGFFNSKRLKGIHLAMKSGMLAAESVYETLCRGDASEHVLGRFSEKIAASWMHAELWAARNYHQPFERGLWSGLAHALLQGLTRGRGVRSRYASRAGHLSMRSA
ncbi:MAG: NAD(P)/FAD-dependent oxidoreductase, partial [Gammaproteobacteria bacterium]